MTFSVVLNFLKGLWSNVVVRYILIGLLVFVAAFVFYKHQINEAYDRGVAYQVSVNEKEQEELKAKYEKMLSDANADRIALNAEIEQQKSEYQKLKSQRENKSNQTQEKVENYAKTSDGAKLCLSSSWMQLYKDSLPQ